MKPMVDPLLCEANALCVAEAPEVFELVDDDDGGRVRILLPTPPAQLEAAVRDAVASCPKQALRIIDE
jgi:ferredoxin